MFLVKFKSWVAGLCVLALVACGGGGSSGDPVLGGGDNPSTAASVDVSTSTATLGDGDSTITVTAIVKDAKNVGLGGTAISWATSAGSLTGTTTTTDSAGRATATFSATDRAAGTATITAASGSARGTATVALQGTRTVVLTSSKSQVGTDGDTATMTAIVRDGNNVAISGAALVWATSAGALSGQTSVTDASGVATAVFTPTRIDPSVTPTATVTATSGLGASARSDNATLAISRSTTSIELTASQPTVGTGGEQITITAFVKDGNNVARPNTSIGWSVSSGVLGSQVTTTTASGVATAVLSAGSDKSNRDAVITTTVGGATQRLTVKVVNTKLSFSGATTLPIGSSMQFTVTAADSKNVPIPGVALSLRSSLGNAVPATATTDASGQALLTYTATNSGSDTVVISGAGTFVTATITVSGLEDELVFISPAPSAKVAVGQTQTLQVRYRKSGVNQAGVDLNLAATIGTLVPAGPLRTGADGTASVAISSGFAGASTVTANLAGSASTRVQATLPINFVATKPANLVLQVTPSALAPNLNGSTTNQASVVAKVTDASGNPVADTTVNFSQVTDPSGGRLQQASAVTDLNGVATVQYLSGAESTASGAIRLRGTVASAPVPPDTTVIGEAVLTVNQSALFIALGTGNVISNFNTETYEKKWTVYVTDANGVAVTNVPVTIKVIPNYFAKGNLVWSETASFWVYETYRECLNEDRNNLNGVLDPGEDTNVDGTLTPGNVVALTASTVTTDASGSAVITMRYAELYASWIGVRLTATAIVAGTESTSFRDFPLDKLAGDYSVKTVSPAGVRSPFGVNTSTCLNAE